MVQGCELEGIRGLNTGFYIDILDNSSTYIATLFQHRLAPFGGRTWSPFAHQGSPTRGFPHFRGRECYSSQPPRVSSAGSANTHLTDGLQSLCRRTVWEDRGCRTSQGSSSKSFEWRLASILSSEILHNTCGSKPEFFDGHVYLNDTTGRRLRRTRFGASTKGSSASWFFRSHTGLGLFSRKC